MNCDFEDGMVGHRGFSVAYDVYNGKLKESHYEQPDMECPELVQYGSDNAGFWMKSCLAKTCNNPEWYKVTGCVSDADPEDLACRHKGCKKGNEIRAKHGLESLLPTDAILGKDEHTGLVGLGKCEKCGSDYYMAKHPTLCRLCRDLEELETCNCSARKSVLRKTIHNTQKYKNMSHADRTSHLKKLKEKRDAKNKS